MNVCIGTFILYAAINALGILFVTIVVPETKGRSLEQIQSAINASHWHEIEEACFLLVSIWDFYKSTALQKGSEAQEDTLI